MLFNSPIFIFAFLPITLIGFYFLTSRKWTESALAWLVVCSFVFYGWWNPVYVWLIAASMIFNYSLGRAISQPSRWRKPALIFGVVCNLLLLGYYKYFDFFISTLNVAFSADFNLQHIILPLAISFFTFTQIAFLVDSYRDQAREYNFLHYCLFVTFFTHLIAGPIVHHKQFLPQFLNRGILKFNIENFAVGITIFGVGLFKKVVLADSLAPGVTEVYGAPGTAISVAPLFLDSWMATLSYTLQLYFDFSGYSDMAIGLSLLFGIRLPINFNSPYKSTSIIEFWRRWHITLSHFLRDYLYFSLGGNRKGKGRRYLNLWLTMLLGGVWHGASLNFIIWGALHGAYLVVNHAWQSLRKLIGLTGTSGIAKIPATVLSVAITFVATMFAWVFFRAEDVHSANLIIGSMTGNAGWDMSRVSTDFMFGISQLQLVYQQASALVDVSGLGRAAVFAINTMSIEWGSVGRVMLLAVLLAIVWLAPNTQQIFRKFQPALDYTPEDGDKSWSFTLSWRTGLIVGLVFAVALSQFFSATPSQFMYFNF